MLFSKLFVSALLLLLQVAVIYVVFKVFNQYMVVLQILGGLLAVAVFLTIITKKESPEFKIPWIVLVFLFPLFGLLIYLLFANPKMNKKDAKRARQIYEQLKAAGPEEEDDGELKKALGDFADVENYLNSNSYLRGSLHNRVTYFKVGEEFWQDLLAELEKAQKFIFMEYFIIDKGKMWDSVHEILKRKASSGVEVRVMYDDIGTAGMLSGNYFKKLRKEGIDCYKFNPFRPVISGIYNNRDHRKITVIDGRVGYTGGVNLGDEYINENKRLGHWKDTAVKIQGPAVDNLLRLFLQAFDMNARRLSDYKQYFVTEHEQFDDEGYIHPFGDGPKPFYAEQIGENNYINLINHAKKYVYITTPYLIIDFNLATALRNAAFRGVDIRLITPHVPDKKIVLNMTRSNYAYLLQAGVKIYEYTPGFIHAKSLIADDEYAFVGTINLDYRSLVHHYECGAVMYHTPCINDIKQDITATIAVSQEITLKNFHMNGFTRLINSVLTIFAPML